MCMQSLPGDIGKPLSGEAGPFQSVGHHQVIKEGSVFLPDLVLLVYHPFLDRIVKRTC